MCTISGGRKVKGLQKFKNPNNLNFLLFVAKKMVREDNSSGFENWSW
jgi:hypothetical protein